MKNRADALAHRLENGARALADFASSLTDEEWDIVVPHDGRKIGVTVHHVASMYPLEIELTQTIVAGKPIVGVTGDVVDDINAQHAREKDTVSKQEALDLLRRNSTAAAEAIRSLSDDDLDRATTVSLYGDAPLTAQFFLEDHPVRHSYHHLARLKAALQNASVAA
jgi:DinB superfamily